MQRFLCHIGAVAGAFASIALTATSCADVRATSPAPVGIRALEAIELASSHQPSVRISEFHYDNSGTDTGERVEISGPAGTDLTGWSVVFYNGSNPGAAVVYRTLALSGTIEASCGGRGVLFFGLPTDGIQNGPSDGFALVSPSGPIELLSYEGQLTASNGPAAGMRSIDVGVSQAGTAAVGSSIQRRGSGTWFFSTSSSFGTCNDADDEQVIDHIVVTPASATILEGATEQFTATAFSSADQPLAGVTFTWSSSSDAVAAVSRGGLVTGAGPGQASIHASAGGVNGTATVQVNEAPLPDLPAVRFSEIHYDNVQTDVGEALEIEGPEGTDLSGWTVVLYNGANGETYDTRALSGTLGSSCDGRGVVVVRFEQDGLQNGGPDGMALVDAAGTIVEFLSYEGTFTAADGPAQGRTSADIGASQSGAPHFQTIQRKPSGRWETELRPSTLGGCYGGTPVTPTNQVSFSGRSPFDAALPVGFEDQLFGTLRAPDDATVATTFVWESLTPAIASIDEDGVFRALTAGTATLRATANDGTTATYSLPTTIATASTTARYGNHTEFGVPTDADPSDDFVLRRTELTSSFNRLRNIPNWVSYNLDASHIAPGQDRCDCFTYDPELPTEFARYTTADYTGAGAAAGFGIDRGHLARSFDRTSGSLDNARTFYFSNIIPQAADNNQGPWAAFESYLGNLALNDGKEVYIVTGASGSQGTVKNEGLITIPAITWKVAVVMSRDQGLSNVDSYDDVQVLAVIMPNRPGIRQDDWQKYLTTVNAVESASGYDVLSLLPDDIERIVESGMQEELGMIDALEAGGTLSAGVAGSLRAKLVAASESHDRGNATAARNQLQALINELDALTRSRRLPPAQGGPISDAIRALIASL